MGNNPVSNVDPNGDNPFLIGAAVNFVSNEVGNLIKGNNFFKGGFQAALMGAIGGGISSGIGSLAQSLAKAGGSQLGIAVFQAGAHALSGGALSAAQGGSFWSGAAAGGLSSGIGSSISAAGGGGFEQWVGGGLSGGIGSYIAGGSFWDGATQGLISGGLNHATHAIQYNLTKNLLIRIARNEGLCTICDDQEIGRIFENIVAANLVQAGFQVIEVSQLKPVFGNTVPDFYIGLKGNKSGTMHSFGGMVEVKAKMQGSGLSLSSQNGQLFKQLWPTLSHGKMGVEHIQLSPQLV